MSVKRVFKVLEGLGLSRLESEVYVYLAKVGPSKVKDLSDGLRITKYQVYPALRSLKNKGIVARRSESSALFSALAFEEVLTLFMKLKTEKAKAIREAREEFVRSWQTMIKQKNT